MKSSEIRSRFLEYYERNGHKRVPSGSLVPSSYDPSVLLTTAGMQPFKPYFLGLDEPPAPRVTSCQKCFRTPDIDQVGLTARHLTFFEMLGNFSFGDYFKAGAVEMAWRFLTEELGIDTDRLWATVHAGDEQLGLDIDQEAVDLWLQQGVPHERIVALGDDNFWKAGPTGPCGPCSEIYYDRGPEYGCTSPACAPGCDCDRYLEFYNLVFMQYDRDEQGVLTPLPQQNIDTGMGLERISSLLQGNVSVFEIDSFREVIAWVEERSGRRYDEGGGVTKAMRVLADHGRGMTFLASDGVTPSNEGRGYVLRRVIRRAIQQAERIGMYEGGRSGVLEGLSQRVVDMFGDHYPELREQRATVVDLLNAEEERFLGTLSKGTAMLREVVGHARAEGRSTIAGEDAFKLHDTFGFPVELTTELAAEQELGVDLGRFDELMREQRERARAAAGSGSLPVEAAAAFVRSAGPSTFVGFGETAIDARVTAVSELGDASGALGNALIKLDRTPFYAEGGGQVSDVGVIVGERGRALVQHVVRYEDDQVIVAQLDGELAVGDDVRAEVDTGRRLPTQANHTATHLLHKALRDHLGDHVRQAGSLVAPDRLRFDFTHPTGLTTAQLEAIERDVNEHIAANEPVRWDVMGIEQARDQGAMMLFGEKYGDVVRMVQVGEGYSRELCGGTHVANTGQIRLFVITSETSVGANTRRIEAITGEAAVRYLRTRADVAEQAAAAVNVDVERLVDRVRELSRSVRQLERELSSLKSGADLDQALASAERVGNLNLVVYRSDALTADELLELSDRVKQKLAPAAVVVGSARDGRVSLIASVSADAVDLGVDANAIIKQVSGIVGGGGGGRPTMARAGGKDASRLDEALEASRGVVRDMLAASPAAGSGS